MDKPILTVSTGHLTMTAAPVSTSIRKKLLTMRPGARPVLSTWLDARGVRYAYDGVSIRRVTHG